VDKKLKIIPRPQPDSVTLLLPKPNEALPLIKCDADVNLLCGNCGARLVEGIIEDEIKNIVIRCPVCKQYNQIK
jgi:DNA-directed RNA polymerase subunit RPC12/RpoP